MCKQLAASKVRDKGEEAQHATQEDHLGTGTPASAALLAVPPRMTSTSTGQLASILTSIGYIDGLKPLGFVRWMMSTASPSSKAPVWIPLVRATRVISLTISLMAASTGSTFGYARSSPTPACESVHRLEYAAFLDLLWRQRSNLNSNPRIHNQTFLQRRATVFGSGSLRASF